MINNEMKEMIGENMIEISRMIENIFTHKISHLKPGTSTYDESFEKHGRILHICFQRCENGYTIYLEADNECFGHKDVMERLDLMPMRDDDILTGERDKRKERIEGLVKSMYHNKLWVNQHCFKNTINAVIERLHDVVDNPERGFIGFNNGVFCEKNKDGGYELCLACFACLEAGWSLGYLEHISENQTMDGCNRIIECEAMRIFGIDRRIAVNLFHPEILSDQKDNAGMIEILERFLDDGTYPEIYTGKV